ncbi:hypothetical protein [Pontibacter harenae]|uniref:glycosyl-4,4'-diaponeurosporenoate acyltransferase CrtO family protein n=1 Tax=Pontibacter harenae TaxID=2894083 RepID=UPI0034E23E69
MISTCVLFITLSWLISLIVFSSSKLNSLENNTKILIKSDRINRYLGVPIFSYIIRNSPFKFLNLGVYLRNSTFPEIIRVDAEINKAERNHLLAFYLVLVGSCLFLLFRNRINEFLYITFSNVIFNLYPFLSLQLQRIRISKLMERQHKQSEKKNIFC